LNLLFSYAPQGCGAFFLEKKLHITFRLYMTFGAGNRALRSNDPRPKCGGEKLHKGRSPTAVFRSPSRYCGEAYTVLLCEVKICYEAPAMDGGRFLFFKTIHWLFPCNIY
jgi:hypothetical protein